MRFDIATMALGLAIFTRQIQMRSVTAFQIGSSFQLRSFTSSSSSTTSSSTTSKMGIMSLNLSAVQETTNGSVVSNGDDNMENLFPQKGKNVEEAPPRMRFAPSPTGRYVLFHIFIYFFAYDINIILYNILILVFM